MRNTTRAENKTTQAITKVGVVAALQEIALLLRLKSGDPFRSRAYAKAAEAIAEFGGDFPSLVEQRRLTEIRGIGHSLAGVIEQLCLSGRSSLLERLRAEVPPGALALSRIPGLTLKKIKKLDAALGINGIDDLKAAIAAGRLRDVPGFGPKSESALLEQISRYENRDNRILLLHALRIAEKVIAHLRSYSSLVFVDLAGAARRWKETVSMIRVTAAGSQSADELLAHFLSFPLIAEIEDRKNDAVTARLIQGARVCLSVAPPDKYWILLHRETGSRAHLKRLEGIAEENGIVLGPTAMRASSRRKILKVKSEEDIYRHLDLQYVPPSYEKTQVKSKRQCLTRFPMI